MDAEVIVIGGGAAGLAGAVVLGRSRRDVVVVDAGEPRNAPAEGVHAFLTRDGVPPAELLALGREEVASYGGRVVAGSAVSARRRDEGGFEVELDDGSSLTARVLLVTTGAVDELPDVPGLREQWGRHVVHCPYCHGWEVRDQPIAVLTSGPMAGHQALLFSQLSDRVTLLTNEVAIDESELALVRAAGVAVVDGHVDRVVEDGDAITGVEVDGVVVPCTTVVVASKVVARSGVLETLGVETAPMEVGGTTVAVSVVADPMTRMTSVPGVYAAGNVVEPMAQVVQAAAAGTAAGAQINAALIKQDAERALATVG